MDFWSVSLAGCTSAGAWNLRVDRQRDDDVSSREMPAACHLHRRHQCPAMRRACDSTTKIGNAHAVLWSLRSG